MRHIWPFKGGGGGSGGAASAVVAKCATLIGNVPWAPFSPPFQAVATQAKPMLRVAVEAECSADIGILAKGLEKLHRADPSVEISTSARGEQVCLVYVACE